MQPAKILLFALVLTSWLSVASAQEVNTFTGAFNYSIPAITVPGPFGSDYKVTLSYNSGVSPRTDASWVGFGWTLDVGSIARDIRGYPDDWSRVKVRSWNKTKDIWTFSATLKTKLEISSYDEKTKKATSGSAGLSTTTRYNNHSGFSQVSGFDLGAMGCVNLSYSLDELRKGNKGSFDYHVNPIAVYSLLSPAAPEEEMVGPPKPVSFLEKLCKNSIGSLIGRAGSALGSNISSLLPLQPSLTETHPPSNVNRKFTESFNGFDLGLQKMTPYYGLMLGKEVGVTGSSYLQSTLAYDDLTVCGYMYSGSATSSAENKEVVMDYFTEREKSFSKDDKFLPFPIANSDNYIVSGLGPAGTFKLYHKTPGHFRPNYISSAATFTNESFDLAGSEQPAIAIGAGFSPSVKNYSVQGWHIADDLRNYRYLNPARNNSAYFRYVNDPGSEVKHSDNFTAERALFSTGSWSGLDYLGRFSDSDYHLDLGQFPSAKLAALDAPSTGASNIQYSTFSELDQAQTSVSASGQHVKCRYSVSRGDALNMVKNSSAELNEQIGEFCVTDANGTKYVYGLPVFARESRSYQIGWLDPEVQKNMSGWDLLSTGYANINVSRGTTTTSSGPGGSGSVKQLTPYNVQEELVSGEERLTPYVQSYLLTEIRTPDYIDRTNDGTSPDDYGGYVRFRYKRVAGSWNKMDVDSGKYWHHSRSPYSGVYYERNSLSDPDDDRIAFSSNLEEMYYLQSIETKTHIAYFITNKTNTVVNINGLAKKQTHSPTFVSLKGSGLERVDAYEAVSDDAIAAASNVTSALDLQPWKMSTNGQPPCNGCYGSRAYLNGDGTLKMKTNHSEYLERIELYAFDGDGVPLQTTNMEYDYSLMEGDQTQLSPFGISEGNQASPIRNLPQGVPNSGFIVKYKSVTPSNTTCYVYRAGRLTLKKVWMEYGAVKNYGISPYEFRYVNRPSASFASEVKSVTDFATALADNDRYTTAQQNPFYDEMNVDNWGYYDAEGASRRTQGRLWKNQNPAISYDPAAYHLKWIKTPTNSEIHIQYEQNSYSYIQDQPALAMIGLRPVSEAITPSDGNSSNKYYLDLRDYSINCSNPANSERDRARALKKYLEDRLIKKRERVYFKLLYALKGNVASFSNPRKVSEYITGYCHVSDITLNEYTTPLPGGEYFNISVELRESGDQNDPTGALNPEFDVPKEVCQDVYKNSKRGKVIGDFQPDESNHGVGQLWDLLTHSTSYQSDACCLAVDYSHSYLRLPLLTVILTRKQLHKVKLVLTPPITFKLHRTDAA